MPLESQGSQDTSFMVSGLPPGVKVDCDPLPQPAPALPHHHAPKLAPGQRYPIINSSGGKAFPIGTAVLFEDEEVIIWENRATPGIQGALHNHDHDYWICAAYSTSTREHKTIVRRADSNPPYKAVSLPGGSGMGVIFVKKGHLETAAGAPDNPGGIVYLVEIKKAEEGGGKSAEPPAAWGAAAGVLYENTEVKIWDMRVPPGQRGFVRAEKGNGILHVDVRGKRQGAQDVAEMLNASEGTDMGGGARKSKMEAYLFQKKKWGNVYARGFGEEGVGASGGIAGEALNNSTEHYRGILVEVKPDIGKVPTARL